MRRFALLVLVLLIGSAAAASWWGCRWYQGSGPLAASVTLVLAKGGADGLGRQLAGAGVITHPELFALAVRLTRGEGDLKAGEYAFPPAISPQAVLALLRSGKTVVHRLTVPEGLTTAEVLALVERADALQGEITDRPAEGELFPSTYNYAWGDKRQALIDRMVRKMHQTLDQLWAERRADLALPDERSAVSLASIVEKETALKSERPKIAAVFYNRLRLDMKLQSDPTVIYALTQGLEPLGRPLQRSDLDTESPYNTYVVKGLPPGPIDNPGRASLLAVLQPDTTDALYFVADGTGGHAFAATLDAHRENVARWRKLEAEKK